MLRNSIHGDGFCSQGSGMEFPGLCLRRARPRDVLNGLAILERHFPPCIGCLGDLGRDRMAIAYEIEIRRSSYSWPSLSRSSMPLVWSLPLSVWQPSQNSHQKKPFSGRWLPNWQTKDITLPSTMRIDIRPSSYPRPLFPSLRGMNQRPGPITQSHWWWCQRSKCPMQIYLV